MDEATLTLSWLQPTLDRCRDLLARPLHIKLWSKPSAHEGRDEAVTELDLAVEALLIEAIHARLPHAAILSEESHPDPSALAAETCFVIDPIDGTNELIAGRSGFAISIALFHRGEPVSALLDMPRQDRRFHGVVGARTYLNGQPVTLTEVQDLTQARLAVSATQLRTDALQDFWHHLPVAALVPTPAFAAKLAAVLANDCDAALYLPVNPHPTAIWDYSAPALLLVEAGGSFTSLDGVHILRQQPFAYVGGWAAGPTALQHQLLGAVWSTASATGWFPRSGGDG